MVGVVAGVAANPGRSNLWNLEAPEADLAAEADDDAIAIGVGGANELLVLVGGEPYLRAGLFDGFMVCRVSIRIADIELLFVSTVSARRSSL